MHVPRRTSAPCRRVVMAAVGVFAVLAAAVPPSNAGPVTVAPPTGQVALATPRATLAASTTLAVSGATIVTLSSDAARVNLTYRRGGRNRSRVIHLAGAPVDVTLPVSASDVHARTLPQRGLRASKRIPVSVTSVWRARAVALLPSVSAVAGGAYSPDGSRIGFISKDRSLPGQPASGWALYIADLASGVVRLASGNQAGEPAQHNGQATPILEWTWLPSGRQVAFRSDATNLVAGVADGSTHSYIKDLDSGAVALVATPNSNEYPPEGLPAWSADGRHMAFVWGQACTGPSGVALTRRGVIVADLVTGTNTQVIPQADCGTTAASIYPLWVEALSPAGDRVVVRQAQVKSYGAMTLYDLARGTTIDILSGPTSFAPDGGSLLSVTQVYGDEQSESSQVVVTDAATGARRVVVAATGSPHEGIHSAAWAPDGRSIAFQFQSLLAHSTFSARDRNRSSDIYVRDLNTGAMSLVTTVRSARCKSAEAPMWAPDGRHLVFRCGQVGQLMAARTPATPS